MRQPKPYFKKQRNAWYANIGPNHRPVKLAEGKGSEKAAWDKYHILMAGRQPLGDDPLIKPLVQQFLDHHFSKSSCRTYEFYLEPLNSWLEYMEKECKRIKCVSELKPYHVGRWIDSRRYKRRSRRVQGQKGHTGGEYRTEVTRKKISQNHERNLLRGVKACFNWAADEEIIGRNPLAKLKIPKAIPRGDEAYLMPEEWERLVAAVTDAPFLDFLTILKETGCRPREAAIVENRWYNRHGACWEFPKEESKGKEENRIVHLNKKATEICRRLALKHPEGPIFRTRLGTRWRRGALNSAAKPWRTSWACMSRPTAFATPLPPTPSLRASICKRLPFSWGTRICGCSLASTSTSRSGAITSRKDSARQLAKSPNGDERCLTRGPCWW